MHVTAAGQSAVVSGGVLRTHAGSAHHHTGAPMELAPQGGAAPAVHAAGPARVPAPPNARPVPAPGPGQSTQQPPTPNTRTAKQALETKGNQGTRAKVSTKPRMSDAGVHFILGAEQYVPTVYKDEGGRPTIGYGHLIRPGERFDKPLTEPEALALARRDIEDVVNPGLDAIKVSLDQHRIDALGSLIFNIGDGNFRKSTLLHKVNAGDLDGAASEFALWNKVKKKGVYEVSKGLIRRRKQEERLWSDGDY